MNPVWLRLAYVLEFLLALPAIFTLWSQVGGQGHLDLMAWYWKLIFGTAAGLLIVRCTAAAIEHDHIFNGRAILWFVALLLVFSAMAALTYYYHLHEAPDESDEETTTALLLMMPDC